MQKGAARIAFAAFEKNRQPNLQIIPIGANYTYADEPRSEFMFEAGGPIFVADYFEKYETNPAAATNELTAEIEKRLRELVIIVKNPADDALTEQLHQLYRNPIDEPLAPHFSGDNGRLMDEKAIADRVNNLAEAEKTDLADRANAYFSLLKKSGATDFGLVQPGWTSWAWTVLGVVGFLPALVGKMLVWPPAALAHWVMKKKARKAEVTVKFPRAFPSSRTEAPTGVAAEASATDSSPSSGIPAGVTFPSVAINTAPASRLSAGSGASGSLNA